MTDEVLTEEEEAGVEAIIFLQSMAGIDEPREVATRNWRKFAAWEKSSTMAAFAAMKPTAQA